MTAATKPRCEVFEKGTAGICETQDATPHRCHECGISQDSPEVEGYADKYGASFAYYAVAVNPGLDIKAHAFHLCMPCYRATALAKAKRPPRYKRRSPDVEAYHWMGEEQMVRGDGADAIPWCFCSMPGWHFHPKSGKNVFRPAVGEYIVNGGERGWYIIAAAQFEAQYELAARDAADLAP